MKVTDKNDNKKEKVKKKGGVNKPKPKKEQVLVVAQEIKYARWLSGNDKKTRDRVLKALKKWLLNCFQKGYEFKEEDFTRVWKGLFYAVWMSDKPLVQEELCDNIAATLDLFPPEQLRAALLMIKAGFRTLATEWYGIDQHRMDKFLMLVRRYLRGSLRCLARCEWSLASCQKYAKMLSGNDGLFALETPHYARNATSMLLHIIDCFLEELSKVSSGGVPPASVSALLSPWVRLLAGCSAPAAAARRLLTALLRQSDEGLHYEEKTRAWKQMGCPAGGPDALEPVSDDEENVVENGGAMSEEDDDRPAPLDPRAGRVDVTLAPLPVPASMLADMLRDMLATAPPPAQRRIRICLERFETLAQGQYPLPVSTPDVTSHEALPRPRRAARSLQLLEQKLRADADELKLRGLSRKHKKRLLRKSRAGLSIVEDIDDYKKKLSKQSNNGEWLVEATETEPKKTEKDTSNKENQDKSKKNAKTNAQKRKNDSALQNETNNKKPKLDKSNKNNLINKQNKKKNLVSNENKKNLASNENKKNNLVTNKNPSKKDKINKLKQTNPQKEVTDTKATPKQKDVKEDAKEIKIDGKESIVKESKAKKPKNQPQIITNGKLNKTEENKKVGIKTKPTKKVEKPTFLVNKVKNFQKQLPTKDKVKKDPTNNNNNYDTPKKVKFELKKNSMQKPVDYYKSVRQSPNIPFDSSKKPSKTNLKPSTPSPINPFFKKKLRMKH